MRNGLLSVLNVPPRSEFIRGDDIPVAEVSENSLCNYRELETGSIDQSREVPHDVAEFLQNGRGISGIRGGVSALLLDDCEQAPNLAKKTEHRCFKLFTRKMVSQTHGALVRLQSDRAVLADIRRKPYALHI